MSNDKTTLADVQPGGRVRLGDALPPLPRTDYNAYSDGSEPLFDAQQMRDYARAALSVQPSPGSQGDALPTLATKVGAYEYGEPGERYYDFTAAQLEQFAAAIAARQPVGEPVADAGRSAAYDAIDRFLRNNMDDEAYAAYVEHLEALWAAVPAQAVDLGPVRVLADHAAGRINHANNGLCPDEVEGHDTRDPDCPVCCALIESQAVGQEPLWCLHVLGMDDVHPAPSKAHAEKAAAWHNEQFKDQAARLGISIEAKVVPWPHSAESHAAGVAEFIPQWLIPQWQLEALEANAAQPAQAVDLAPVRDVFRRWHANELNSTDAMLALVEALAVIDSQAVGNG